MNGISAAQSAGDSKRCVRKKLDSDISFPEMDVSTLLIKTEVIAAKASAHAHWRALHLLMPVTNVVSSVCAYGNPVVDRPIW